ncbi:MAG: transposase [Albidovulum sp.]|nr:transposase [Albidovulum sp.]
MKRSITLVGEYVREQAHTNGMESFWSMLKRACHGTFHHISAKHLDRYVRQFSGKHNMRRMDAID